MINKKCLEKEWIEKTALIHHADKILVEKAIRALILLEGLVLSELDFCFKGGTAVFLLLGAARRQSIDIDIIIPNKKAELDEKLEIICKENGFARFVKQERILDSKIDKEHYKFYFLSAITNQETPVLLDVLKEEVLYKNIIRTPITCDFVFNENEITYVKTPDFNNIFADKITAFAPNSTGIPYIKKGKEMGMEIIKQLYDIGCLFEYIDDINTISSVFQSFVEVELNYRDMTKTSDDVIEDILNTAFTICLRKDFTENCNFKILSDGILRISSFIFSEKYHIEKAILNASQIIYLVYLIKHKIKTIQKYSAETNMKDWVIKLPMDTKLNKLKKSNPKAFFYLYQTNLIQFEQ